MRVRVRGAPLPQHLGIETFRQPPVQELAKPVVSDVPHERAPARECVVVLTRDTTLLQTLKALGSVYNVVTVHAETDLAGALVDAHTGVVIVDAGAAVTEIDELIERLNSQFPELVLVVAGRLEDQSTLTAQITRGTVYRFLHKPVSEQRVKLFVEAAFRRSIEEKSATAQAGAGGGAAEVSAPPPAFYGAIAAAGVMLLVGAWYLWPASREASPAATASSAAGANVDGTAQPVPSAQSAAERAADPLLVAAERELAAQHLDDAQKLVDQVRSMNPDSLRAAFLATQIAKRRERTGSPRPAPGIRSGPAAVSIPQGPAVAPPSEGLQSPAVTDFQPSQARAITPGEGARQDTSAPAATLPAVTPQPAVIAPPAAPQATVAPRPVATTDLTPSRPVDVSDTSEAAAPTEAQRAGPQAPAAEDRSRANDVVSATSLAMVRYSPPSFPVVARERGITGWVEIQFTVKTDGSVDDINVVGAQPVGVFEQAALDAARKWRYKPVERDGRAVEQQARLRLRFALDR